MTDKGGHCTDAIWHMGLSHAHLLDAHVSPELAAVMRQVLSPQPRRCAARRIPCICSCEATEAFANSRAHEE